MSHTAIIAGATGLIGGHILDQLLADPQFAEVIVVTRRPTGRSDDKLREIICDFANLGEALADVSADVAFCALGTTIKAAGSQAAFRAVDYDAVVNVAHAAKACGAETFCVVSSIGANTKSANFYLRVKGETGAALREVGFGALHLFRPSLLLGRNSTELRMAEKLWTLPIKLLGPLMVGPARAYRAIEASIVARAMIRAGHSAITGTKIHTYDDMS